MITIDKQYSLIFCLVNKWTFAVSIIIWPLEFIICFLIVSIWVLLNECTMSQFSGRLLLGNLRLLKFLRI